MRLATVLVLLLLAAACTAAEAPVSQPTSTETAAPAPTPEPTPEPTPSIRVAHPAATATVTPVQIATPEPTPEPTPAPTPEPTPALLEGTCPSTRERSGQTYTYSPDDLGQEGFYDLHCGPILASDRCPESREHAGLEFHYDREIMTRQTAIEEYCGPLDSNWGLEFSSGHIVAANTTVLHDYPSVFEIALELVCIEDQLYIALDTKGPNVYPTNGMFAYVLYGFTDDEIADVDPNSMELIEDDWLVERTTNEVAFMAPDDRKRRAFVDDLLDHPTFIIAMSNPYGGANSGFFDITGAQPYVTAVLESCDF